MLFFPLLGKGQTYQIEKELFFGGTKTDKLIDLIKITGSNEFLVVGLSNSTDGDLQNLNPSGDNGIVIFRIDSALNIIWKQFVPGYIDASNLILIPHSKFSVLGVKTGQITADLLSFEISSGQISNLTSIQLDHIPYLKAISRPKLLHENGKICVGFTYESYVQSNKTNIQIIVLDSLYNLLWKKELAGLGVDNLHKLYIRNNSLYVWIQSNSNNNEFANSKIKTSDIRFLDIWLFSLNLVDGKIDNKTQIGNNSNDSIIDTEICSDGFYLLLTISGTGGDFFTKTSFAGYNNVVCKVNLIGQVIWQRNTGSFDYSSLEVLPNDDLLILSTSTFRRFTKEGNFIFFDNSFSIINPIPYTSSQIITESKSQSLCFYTKNANTGTHLGNEIYISKLARNPKPIELQTISKTWICINESINVTLDTNTIFNLGNKFIYSIIPSGGNPVFVGESETTNFNFTIPNFDTNIINYSSDYTLQIESTSPTFNFQINNLKVQATNSNYFQNFDNFPSTINRGETPELFFNLSSSYSQTPAIVTINGDRIGTMSHQFAYSLNSYKDSAYIFIEKVEDLCGTHILNQKKIFSVIDNYPKQVDQYIWGGSNNDEFEDMVVDADKNIYIFGNSVSVDGDINENRGGIDILVIKIDSSGNVLFKKTFGGSLDERVFKAKVRPNGNIVFTGYSLSDDYENLSLTPYYASGLITEIRPNGDLVWAKKFGFLRSNNANYYTEIINDLTFDNSGNIYVCGVFDNQFGLRKHSSIGDVIWQRKLGQPKTIEERATAIEIDSQNNIVVVGYTGQQFQDYKGGKYDATLVKYSKDGELLNSRHLGGSSYDRAFSLLLQNDKVYVSGATYSNDYNFPNDLPEINKYFLYRLNSNFDSLWVKTYKKAYSPWQNTLTKGPNSTILMTAGFDEGQDYSDSTFHFDDFGTGSFLNIDSSGNTIWMKSLGTKLSLMDGKILYLGDSIYIYATTVGQDFQESTNSGDVHHRIGKNDIWLSVLGKRLPCSKNYTQRFPNQINEDKYYQNAVNLNNSFQAGGNYSFTAGKQIELLPGTVLETGSTIKLQIGNCR